MGKPTYIVADKHSGVWYFRRRVPRPCHRLVKHKLILRSLGTTDRETALRYGALCAIASETIFIHLKNRCGFDSQMRSDTLVKMLKDFRRYWPIEKVRIAHLAAAITAWLREDDEEETLARLAYANAIVRLEDAEKLFGSIE